MTTRICKCCGQEFGCGLNDDPNVCRSCQLMEGFSDGAGVPTSPRQTPSADPVPSDSPTDNYGQCERCQAFAPIVISMSGQKICPLCNQRDIESTILPASHQVASNIPTSPDPQPAFHEYKPDSLRGGSFCEPSAAARGRFTERMHIQRAAIRSTANVCVTGNSFGRVAVRPNAGNGGNFWSAIL